MGALSAGFDTVSPGLAFSQDQELMSTQPLLLESRMLTKEANSILCLW